MARETNKKIDFDEVIFYFKVFKIFEFFYAQPATSTAMSSHQFTSPPHQIIQYKYIINIFELKFPLTDARYFSIYIYNNLMTSKSLHNNVHI